MIARGPLVFGLATGDDVAVCHVAQKERDAFGLEVAAHGVGMNSGAFGGLPHAQEFFAGRPSPLLLFSRAVAGVRGIRRCVRAALIG